MQSSNSSLGELKRETPRELTQTVEQLRTRISETAGDMRQRLTSDLINAAVSDYVRSRGERLVKKRDVLPPAAIEAAISKENNHILAREVA